MLKETKEAYLKHDLYKLSIPKDIEFCVFELENMPEIKPVKCASKGMKFVYCETNYKDNAMGWYADDGSGSYRAGNFGFGKMSNDFAQKHLTEPVEVVGKSKV